jgi:hypothetical protein
MVILPSIQWACFASRTGKLTAVCGGVAIGDTAGSAISCACYSLSTFFLCEILLNSPYPQKPLPPQHAPLEQGLPVPQVKSRREIDAFDVLDCASL